MYLAPIAVFQKYQLDGLEDVDEKELGQVDAQFATFWPSAGVTG